LVHIFYGIPGCALETISKKIAKNILNIELTNTIWLCGKRSIWFCTKGYPHEGAQFIWNCISPRSHRDY